MQNHVRLSVVGVVVVLAATLLGAPPASAAKAAVTVTLSAPSTVDRGDSVRLTGKVASAGKRLQRVPVRVMRMDGRSWKRIATVRTSSKGTFKHVVTLTKGARYRVQVAATSRRSAAVSPSRPVKVRPVMRGVSPKGSSYAVVKTAKVVSGTLEGKLKGRKVELYERPRGGSWKRVDSARTTASGRFTLSYTPKRSGIMSVRVTIPAASGLTRVDGKSRTLVVKKSVKALLAENPACVGAKAMRDRGCRNPKLDGLVLPTRVREALRQETGNVYTPGCWTRKASDMLPSCTYGNAKSKTKIALIGDSHAASYLGGMRDAVAKAGWRMDTYMGYSCRWQDYSAGHSCRPRLENLQKRLLAGTYDAIVYTGLRQWRGTSQREADSVSDRYAAVWGPVAAQGTKVIGLADFGYLTDDHFGCLFESSGMGILDCSIPKSVAYGGPDPIPGAVARLREQKLPASLVDLTNFYCPTSRCPLVVGNTIVYRDNHHLSGTFSSTIGPYLLGEVRKILAG